MKKNVLLFLIATIIIAGCSKESKKDSNYIPEMNAVNTIYKLHNYELHPANAFNKSVYSNVDTLCYNLYDDDDTKINKYMLQLSFAIAPLLKDPNFNAFVINQCGSSSDTLIELMDLASKAPGYYNKINSKLSKVGLSISSIAADFEHRPTGPNPSYPQTYDADLYSPAIYIPNFLNINPSYAPVITPGIQADSRTDTTLDEVYGGWYWESLSANIMKEVAISEIIAKNSLNPIFALVPHYLGSSNPNNPNFVAQAPTAPSGPSSPPVGAPSLGETYFASNELSIENTAYYYESSWQGRAEFTIASQRFTPYTGIPEPGIVIIEVGSNPSILKRIKQSEVGQLQNVWRYHAPNKVPYDNPYNSAYISEPNVHKVFWNTFERDWLMPVKSLGTPYHQGHSQTIYGKRKYFNEWYAWFPETLQLHDSKFPWIYNNWAHWNNSWKSKFRIWRVEG